MTLATRRGVPASLSADEQLPRVDWNDLGPEFFAQWGRPNGRFEPEHLTVYGRSGSGKTHFVGYALSERHRLRGSHVTAVATKRADATLTRLGWPVIGDWPPNYGDHCVIFWAKAKGISQIHRVPQKAKVKGLMNALWRPGANMVVYWDELTYVQSMLRLGPELETFYREGRTHGITNVASMQRPSNVTRLAHSEAGWTVAFPPKDADDRTRIAEVLGDRTFYRAVLAPRSRRNPLGLDSTRYEFVIKQELTGQAFITHLPPPSRRRPIAA